MGTESRETNNLVLVLDTSNSRVVHDVENLKVIEQKEVPDCANRTNSPTDRIEDNMKNGMVVLGLATSHCPKKCRYVYTPMLSGLRWPGQTSMGSWPPALMACDKIELPVKQDGMKTRKIEVLRLFRRATHTHKHSQSSLKPRLHCGKKE